MAYPSGGEPIDIQVLDALRQRLEGIVTPTYHHDVAHVVTFHSGVMEGLQMPCIAILPVGKPQHTKLANVVVKRQLVAIGLSLRIESEVGVSDPEDPVMREVQWFLADVGHAIRQDPTLGGLAWSVDVVNEQAFPRDGGAVAWAEIEAVIHYHHRYDDPSALC